MNELNLWAELDFFSYDFSKVDNGSFFLYFVVEYVDNVGSARRKDYIRLLVHGFGENVFFLWQIVFIVFKIKRWRRGRKRFICKIARESSDIMGLPKLMFKEI